jgi:hypothetical protein
VIGCPNQTILVLFCLLRFILLPCLLVLLVRFAYDILFLCPPPSRTASSSQFPLPSRCRMARCTHGAGGHVSDTKNSDVYMQPNKISSHTGSTTKTTKHDWVNGMSMHLTMQDRLSISAAHDQSNQSCPK